MNIVKDSDLFKESQGVTAYMARLYTNSPIPSFVGGGGDYGESLVILSDNIAATSAPGAWSLAFWNYGCIREASYFIQEFPKYAGNFNEVHANAWQGEAYFIRAYNYFQMVRLYGGVPIVDRVLNYPEESIEELQLPRAKEADCYDFILRDLDEAARLLPEESTVANGLDRGRVNRYVALGMKARVALYAGCIAKYAAPFIQQHSGSEAVQQELVGVPASRAAEYFGIAWTAAKAVEDSRKYELAGENLTDAEEIIHSYRNIWQDKGSKEILFGRFFSWTADVKHNLDANTLPYQLGGVYANHVNPTMDYVKTFDDVNGNPINWDNHLGTDATYTAHLFTNPADAFSMMEPRFHAIVVYPNAVYKGETIEIRKGILAENSFVDGAPLMMDSVYTSASLDQKYKDTDMMIQGKSGMGNNNTTSTGFYCVKCANENMPHDQVSASNSHSESTCIDMRYAEILLTLAEAAVELGRPNDAIPYMNRIRKRAGSKKTFTSVTLNDVRKECRMEFLWDYKIFWDMRRWRIIHLECDNSTRELLWPIYVMDKNAYYLKRTDTGTTDSKRYTFNPTNYYNIIDGSEIAKNGKLIQNPGY
jgi:tetratricopeptide (TPR) repeat protein